MARGRPSKKDHIVEAACVLFTKQGYQSTSIEQVIAQAEVSKPTVYSNFPTKLALWESVLLSITERAKAEMYTTLARLQSNEEIDFLSGWLALWEVWAKEQERLAIYRVQLGERHKMADTTMGLFEEFDGIFDSALQSWVLGFSELNVPYFIFKSVTKEAILTPALFNQDKMVSDEFIPQLRSLIK